ncbi:hypothetical protein QFC20_001919 [Naganishia adeliensis]|uniref:Uncharacterized protein n=1 Tax=Naganishia adeliensis TaxID=92952 RepID=A0ACC2WQ92_9TREE|nr:hypothetical protein QFC20_001919 [Naganishia adeliensis]
MQSNPTFSPDMFDDIEKKGVFPDQHLEVDEGAEKPNHVEGNVLLLDAEGQIRLVPTPTDSPRDPLNFSKWRKAGILVTVAWFSTMALSVVGGFGSLALIFFGLYGKQIALPAIQLFIPYRQVLETSSSSLSPSLLAASSIWAAKSGTSFESHFSARLVQGIAGGATESLLPLILTDMSFLHERAYYFGCYWVAQSIFTAILNAGSTYEAVHLSWQWYYWIFGILAAVGTVMVVFLCPETKFARPAFAIDGQMTKVDEYGNMVVLSDEEAKALGDRQGDNRLHAEDTSMEYTYVKSLSLMQPIEKNALRVALTSYWQMTLALTNPAIVWALGAASAVLGVTIAQSLSFGGILGHTYHWKPENVGLNYLGALPAAALAFLTCGWGGDKVNLYLARRNGGVHLPEHRLPSLIFPVVTGIGMFLMYGFYAQSAPSTHWISIVFSNNYATYVFICVLINGTT